MSVERIYLLGVPIDVLKDEDIEEVAMSFLKREGIQQIVFLSLWDFLKARHNNEFRKLVLKAGLVLPTSKSLISAAKFLQKPVPIRRRQFDVIIAFLNALEAHFMSIYLLGGRKESLAIAERNVKNTFPTLKVVGRFAGFYPKTMERDIVTAISKAEPELTIVSNGIKGGVQWINKNRVAFKSGIFIYDKNILDIFAKNKKAVSEKVFNSGMEYVLSVFSNPLRILNFFRYLGFKILVLWDKLFGKD
ncbi:MAG: WecB/TagA/CpsF family glycosyltransferase [Treponemataceae bacterium]